MLHGPGSGHLALGMQLAQSSPGSFLLCNVAAGEEIHAVARGLELGRENLSGLGGGNGEGNQRGRDIHIQEGAGHGVLAADGGDVQIQLGIESTQQGGEGLAPAQGLFPKLFKVFLEGEVGGGHVAAGGSQFGNGGQDGLIGTGIGICGHPVGIKAPGHDGAVLRLLARQYRQQCCHGLGRGTLVLAAEGHEHAARADGGVKPLGKAPAGGTGEASGHLPQGGEQRLGKAGTVCRLHGHLGVLDSAVGIQEGTAQIHNGLALPVHDHAGAFCDHSHPVGFQILPLGGGDEGVGILRRHHDGHALLGFGDGQLSAVQTLVLFPHGVQLNFQAVGQLADGHGHAAGAEVVAALDEAGDIAVPEQPLDLPLLRGVALLDLGGHGGQGLAVMALGRAGGTADAVPAGAAAQQNHHVAGGGTLPDHIVCRRGAYYGTHFQVLGHIAGMVDLTDLAGGKADLVAVGGVARRGGLGQLALGELAGNGFGDRRAGIPAAGDPHGLIDVSTAGEGVPDASADAGGGAAEGLDFRGMVVGFILEHQQPVLGFAVDRGCDMDRAGIDLLALVEVGKQTALLEHLGTDGGHVHQGLGTYGCLLGAVDLFPGGQVTLIGLLRGLVQHLHRIDVGGEGGVAAVIGPIGVHHPDFRDGGVPVFLVPEVGLEELQVVQVHGKPQLIQQFGKTGFIQSGKAGDGLHTGGHIIVHLKGIHGLQTGFPGLHRVDDVMLDLLHVFRRQFAGEQVYLGGAHGRTVPLGHQLDAGPGGVCPLVELAGQILHGEGGVVTGGEGGGGVVHLGLGEHCLHGPLEDICFQAFHVIAVNEAHAGQGRDSQQSPQLVQKAFGLLTQSGLFFHINASYHI